MNSGPVYDHDCRECRYLGTTGPTLAYPGRNAVDHYVHDTALGKTLIQRGGSQGHDYHSTPLCLAHGRSWAVTIALLESQEPQNSLALAFA